MYNTSPSERQVGRSLHGEVGEYAAPAVQRLGSLAEITKQNKILPQDDAINFTLSGTTPGEEGGS